MKANSWGVVTMLLIGVLMLTAWIGYPAVVFTQSKFQPITANFSTSSSVNSNVSGLGNVGILVSLGWSGVFSADPPFITRLYKTLNLQPTGTTGNSGTIAITLDGKELIELPFDFTHGSIQIPYTLGAFNIRWQGEPTFSSAQASISQVPFLSFSSLTTEVNSEYKINFYLDFLSLYDHPLGSIKLLTQTSQASISVIPLEDVAIVLAALVILFALFSDFEVPDWDSRFGRGY